MIQNVCFLARKRALVQLFAHLETEIGRVGNMKQTLLDQMEVKVKKLLTHGNPCYVNFMNLIFDYCLNT